MYPEPIEHYHAPTELSEALQLIAGAGAGAAILAGGQSLMPQMKARTIAPRSLIDINRISGLDAITFDAEAVTIGALVRLATAAKEAGLRGPYAALAEAAAAIGDRQVRNRATLVGSIVFGANYGDIAPAAAVLGGTLVIANAAPAGAVRNASIEAFVRGVGQCDLRPGDLVTAIRIPLLPASSLSCYLKHGRVAQDRATLGVAVWLDCDAGGACSQLRIAIGGLGSHPIVRASAVEALLEGRRLRPELMQEAGALAAATLTTQTDELASAAYRSQLLRVYVPQALASTVRRL